MHHSGVVLIGRTYNYNVHKILTDILIFDCIFLNSNRSPLTKAVIAYLVAV